MLRRPIFWTVFVVLSAAAAVFTFKNFSTAFPLVSIDLKMDRAGALRAARELALKYAWPPAAFDDAADFSGNQEAQNFIELEGGGKQELGRIVKEKIFALYTWRVRHFKEGDPHETLVRFTPDGTPDGFYVRLPDQEAGATRPVEEARQIAETAAARDWNVDFGRYRLIESSKDVKPGGRTDHTFVYERQDEHVGEGHYRLRLVVGGDKLIELNPFVQVPEAFSRRYEQMRSANDAIGAVDQIALFSLYLLGFCGVGLFFMIRQHWVLWRQPLVWGTFLALLLGLQQLNEWPLLWMGYDTAVPASGFAIRQVLGAAATFGGFAVLLTVSFMAAETLTRRAFPHRVQFWKVWSRPVTASKTILGQTLTGYLLVAPFFAYEIVLYFFAQGKLGWWSPSDTLLNPDMFANYIPSLSAIAQAAQAGFWEESLFRAVPLACAALIGDRFGKRRAFIGGAMILQALVFASGHAGYANQPAYARVVELIIPSFAFGSLYLAFGLLPGIVLHFTYDTVWMSLPLFVSSTGRAHFEQALVVLLVLIPLWVVIANRVRMGKWTEVPEEALNGSWEPREVPETQPEPAHFPQQTVISPAVLRRLPVAGVVGLLLWIFASPFHIDAPPIGINRREAESRARMELISTFPLRPDGSIPSWTVLSHVEGQPGEQNRFVWKTAGRSVYEKLLGVYVTPPHWFVRYARFQGDVEARAEEYQVLVDGSGRPFRTAHDLPETTPGKNLTQDEARALALEALNAPAVTAPEQPITHSPPLQEISAEASKKPARTDWTFVFKDPRDYGLTQGEPRISIEISGDQVVDSARYIYVPEEWSRNERRERNLPGILAVICTVVLVAIVVCATIIGAVHWSRRRHFSSRVFLGIFGLLFLVSVANTLNNWPVQASQASTAQPLALTAAEVISTSAVFGLAIAVGLGLAGGLLAARNNFLRRDLLRNHLVAGVSLGLMFAGIGALARHAVPSSTPLWGNMGPASAYVPFVTAALSPLTAFFIQSIVLLAVIRALTHKPRALVFLIVVGLAVAGSGSIETIPSWLIVGLTTGIVLMLVYLLVFRDQPMVIIPAVATAVALSALRDGIQHPYPTALPASIAAVVLLALVAYVWLRSLSLWEREPRSGG
jgi:hypothetical protein